MPVDTVKRLLSFRSTSRPEPDEAAEIVGLNDGDAGEIFEALASETTRDVLEAVYDRPGTASEVAENVGTSIQNTKYHLDKLRDAGLIEVADTWYSEQGNEMKVYAPTSESVVLFAGDETTRSSLRETLRRVLGAVGVLAVGSLLVERIVRVDTNPFDLKRPSTLPPWIPLDEAITVTSPGLIFFTGGLIVVVVVLGFSLLDERA